MALKFEIKGMDELREALRFARARRVAARIVGVKPPPLEPPRTGSMR